LEFVTFFLRIALRSDTESGNTHYGSGFSEGTGS
jgi:hypothetical protein